MKRMTMEQAISRQQIAMIRDWDAYQASLLGKESRRAQAAAGVSRARQATPNNVRKMK